MHISFAVTGKLIRAFVNTTQIVQFRYFLSPKFQASGHLWFVSDLFKSHIVCFLMTRLKLIPKSNIYPSRTSLECVSTVCLKQSLHQATNVSSSHCIILVCQSILQSQERSTHLVPMARVSSAWMTRPTVMFRSVSTVLLISSIVCWQQGQITLLLSQVGDGSLIIFNCICKNTHLDVN